MPVKFFFIMSTINVGSVAIVSCMGLVLGFLLKTPSSCGKQQQRHKFGVKVVMSSGCGSEK